MAADHEALLVLEDGRCFSGRSFGGRLEGPRLGEVIFNTSMTGYQEIASDPSYAGQIVAFTAPQIGNYGVTSADGQAEAPRLSGLVVRELSPLVSNWRAQGSLAQWLTEHDVPGITGVDTRALTRHLRERGAMRAGIFSAGDGTDIEALVARVREHPSMEGLDLASRVSTTKPYRVAPDGERRGRVAVIDFGVKRGILRQLAVRGLELEVLPANTSAEAVLALQPDGVLLSNGPGDPAPVAAGIETARQLLGKLPLLGICLGHQILALALGARTYKMPFGHHGGNHPVRDEATGEIWITAQNHGFAVDPETLPPTAQVTQISLYDRTLEGFCVPDLRVTAVQFHPEGAPGPSDAQGLFDRFAAVISPEEA
jgi:carbamoyl-phosphate synthase small subunit